MTSRPEHNRNRTRTGPHSHTRAPGHGASHATSRAHEPTLCFEAPPLDITTTATDKAVWVHLRGEADLANHEQLRTTLTNVKLDGAAAVHLVLNDLTFCDLSAFRHLVAFAKRVRNAGRDLTAHGACPTIKKVAGLLDVAQDLHFV